MAKHLAYGTAAEMAARTYLERQGYLIRGFNIRFGRAELDVVAEKNGVLVFVEVKARNSTSFGWPEEAVSNRKQELLLNAAELYIEEHSWQKDIRFDIISIIGSGSRQQILHIEDAFH